MKIYIAGQFTGIKYGQAYENFAKAEKDIKETGHEAINPLKIISEHARWEQAMRESIKLMLDCQGIFLLDNWKESEGAKIEFELACRLKFDIFYERDLHHLLLLRETCNA
jgi:hypothetical protein